MFTGIVEEIGVVRGIRKSAESSVLTIGGNLIFQDLRPGDSVAVNGVCLTASACSGNAFTADVMHETLNRSSLGSLKVGSPVNLERAMPINGRFGGHIVSGHIDGTGRIESVRKDGNAVWFTIRAAEGILRYIVEKGSVAVDGISLTVAEAAVDHFSVSVIPHTAENTVLSGKSVGDSVNLENDVVGKYIEKLMGHAPEPKAQRGLTKEKLMKLGY